MKQKIPTKEQAQYLILPQMLILWDTHRFSVNKYTPTAQSTEAELQWYETARHTEEVLRRLIGLTFGLNEVSQLEAKLRELGLDDED